MRLLLIIGLIAVSSPTVAALWPMINSPRITSCSTGGQGRQCTLNVKYASEGTMFVVTNEVIPPDPSLGLDIIPIGIHCDREGTDGGSFKGCNWEYGTMHTPQLLSKCKLKSTDSWELTPDSTCFTQQAWGPHSGAAPGGECVIFAQSKYGSMGAQRTPIGLITAMDAANNGNSFCAKALPPSVTCELMAPSLIDLGVVRPGESSQQDDFGEVSCGEAPKITKLVDGDQDYNGVKISVEPTVIDSTKLRINSTVTVSSDAAAGDYSATYVFIASPN